MIKILSRFYSKFLNSLTTLLIQELRCIQKEITLSEEAKTTNINSKVPLISDNSLDKKIIVSLTTYSHRIHSVYITIESIAKQTMKADKIILWLDKEEFNDETIPISLKNLKKRGLTIKYYKNIKGYKKLIPTLKEHPNDIIITVDDDIIYNFDLIENLYKTYTEYPNSIICYRGHLMKFDNENNILPYNKWEKDIPSSKPSLLIFPTGAGGILYFPGCFNKDVLNEEIFMKLAPNGDDIWFKVMSLLQGTKCKTIGINNSKCTNQVPLESSKINDLAQLNVIKKYNDKQLENLIKHYKLQKVFDQINN